RLRTTDFATLPLAVRADLPDWLVAELGLPEDELLALASALSRPASVDLRANTLKISRDDLLARLTTESLPAQPTPPSPRGLRRRERTPVFQSAAFKEGLFEMQDEGSQLVALLVEPRRGERVVDFCAGAGGKTLALGAMMANSGTLYAFDASA